MQRKIISWLIAIVFGTAAVLLFFLNALLIWVVTGPRSLNQVTPYIERSLADASGNYNVKIEDTQLVWDGWQNPIDVRARNMRVLTADGAVFATFPEVSVGFNIPQLVLGKLTPRTLVIKNPEISLFQGEDGNILFGFGSEASGQGLPVQQVITGLAQDKGSEQGAHIHRIIVRDATLSLGNKASGVFFKAPRTQLFIARTAEGYRGSFELNMQYEQKVSGITSNFSISREQHQLQADITFSELTPKMLAQLSDKLKELAAADMPATGNAIIKVNTDSGDAEAEFAFKTAKGTFNDPAHFPEPIVVDACDIRGRAHTATRTFSLDTATCRMKETMAIASGEFSQKDDSYDIRLRGRVEHMPADDLYRYWPLGACPVARSWVTTNITKGHVPEATITLNITPQDLAQPTLPESVMDATIKVENANINYLKDHPVLEHVNGVVKFSGKGVRVDATSGTMLSGSVLSRASLVAANLWPEYPHMTLDMDITAPAQDVVQYIDLPDLNYAKPLGLNAKTVSGQVAGNVKMEFYMVGDDKPHEIPDHFEVITMDAKTKITNGAAPKFLNTYDLTNVNADLTIKDRQVTFKGDLIASGAGVPAKVEVVHDFTGKAGFDNKYHIETNLLASHAPLFGYPEFSFLKGKIGIVADSVEKGPNLSAKANLDLAQASVNLAEIGYTKAAGQPLVIALELTETAGDAMYINSFEVKGSGVAARGNAVIAADKKTFSTLVLDAITFGANDLALSYSKAGGIHTINAKGRNVDLSPLFRSSGSHSREEVANIAITTDLEKITLRPEAELYKMKGGIHCDAKRCTNADVTGQTKGGKPFAYAIKNDKGKRTLTITADDAGELIRVLDISQNLNGGTLKLTGEFNDNEAGNPLNGKLLITDYELYKAPVLTKILTLASLTGILDTLSGKGISFKRMLVPFTYTGDIITLKNAKTHGSALGITADGTIDTKGTILDLEGTVVPAYALNTMVGNIPVVGQVLTGGKGQGVFAANYKVKGSYKDPEVTLNPLSILTPGFLRGLFDVFDKEKEGVDEDDDALSPAE